MSYDGFISYSHAVDGALAPALQSGLQRLAKPWNRRRALHIFRDETGLSTNPHLWASVEAALDESAWFILLASPEAATSKWVNQEIEHWLTTRPADHILPVVTGGTWSWDSSRGGFDPASTAVPPALSGAVAAEPRHLDLRWARTETDLDLRNSRFRDAIADLGAPLHGIPKDELEGEDIRQHRRAIRLARAAVAGLALLLVAALVGGALAVVSSRRAVRERNRADDQHALADTRRIAAEAIAGADSDPARSLLLAAEASGRADSIDTRSALLGTLLRSGSLVSVRSSSAGPAVAADLTSDGRSEAVAADNGVVRIVEVGTGVVRDEIATGHKQKISLVRLSPDGRLLATGDQGGLIEIRVVADGSLRCPPVRLSRLLVAAGAFAERGDLFIAHDDGAYSVRAWDTRSCEQVVSWGPNVVGVFPSGRQDVAVSPDGKRVAFEGNPVSVWDSRLKGPPLSVSCPGLTSSRAATFTADGGRVIFADEHRLCVFDSRTGGLARAPIEFRRSKPDRLVSSPDGRRVAVVLADGSIDVIDLETGAGLEQTLTGLSTPPLDISFTAAQRLTAIGARETAVWDLDQLIATASLLNATASLREPGVRPFSVEFAPDGDSVAVAAEDGAIYRVAVRDGRELARLEVHEAVPMHGFGLGVTDVAFDPGGEWIASIADTDARLVVTDLRSGVQLHPPLKVGKPAIPFTSDADVGVYDLALSTSADAIVVANGRGEIILVDVGGWRERWRITVGLQGGWLHPVAFATDGTNVYVGTGDGLGVYDASDGRRRDVVHRGRVTAVTASADGETVAAAFADGAVVVFDARTLREEVVLTNPDGLTTSLAFVPQQEMLVASTSNGTVVLWNLPTARLVGILPPPHGKTGGVGAAHVGGRPDGASIAVAYEGGVVVWSLDPIVWRNRACALAGRNLTRAEWAQYLPSDKFHSTCAQWPAGT